jgi:hypothetical protein
MKNRESQDSDKHDHHRRRATATSAFVQRSVRNSRIVSKRLPVVCCYLPGRRGGPGFIRLARLNNPTRGRASSRIFLLFTGTPFRPEFAPLRIRPPT